MNTATFQNEPFTDWSDPANVKAMQQALAQVHNELGKTYPLVINGEHITTAKTIESRNPANPHEVVGRAASATAEQAEQAIAAAVAAFDSWRKAPAAERIALVRKIAAEIRRRKFEFIAWLVYEVGKTWVEADADVGEAIDFCMFYAQEMERLAGPQPINSLPGERDAIVYVPLGAGVAIPPWNFALAITTGLTVAPVVTGNTVVLKPSPRSPIIAAKLMEVIESVGAPAGVVNFVTGEDAVIGDVLVDYPRTRFISFTGSKEVGLRIFERAAKRQPGQKWLKRTILEMGGKDTLVVDETADLDAAAEAITASAFSFSGQKCSACSRVVAVEEIYEPLLDKVVERARALRLGDPTDPKTAVSAVIDERSLDKIRQYIDIGKQEGRLMLGGEVRNDNLVVPPTIFADVAPDARLSQEEVFGPVLTFVKAKDYDEALEIANNTEFGLTGGVFSQDQERLDRAREDFHVGNLYFNRKITGAMVGAHPFGGFNMSGTDSKAGGPDYLLLFMQMKSIAERVSPGTGTARGGE
jgi:1-pyrroline-5-carboxylate dehydrogenase